MSNFFRALKKLNKALSASAKQSKPRAATPVVQKPLAEPADTTPALAKNDNADFELLLSLYRKHKTDEGGVDVLPFIKEVNPNADAHTCPYCKTVHEFKAARARKCPACSNKMVVRKEHFLTEDQAKELDAKVQDFYQDQGALFRVGNLLEMAQQSRVHKQHARYLYELAEAFRFMAQVENQKAPNDFDFWDRAWGYYNQARVAEMKELSRDMMQFSQLPQIFWDMTQMLVDQAATRATKESSDKGKRQAVIQAHMTLAEAAKLGADPYFRTNLYELVKKQVADLNLSPEEVRVISSDAASRMHLDTSMLRKYEEWLRELDEYQIIN